MTEFDSLAGDEAFDISSTGEAVYVEPANEGGNVCRVAALSARFSGNQLAYTPLSREFEELGFGKAVTSFADTWSQRDLFEDDSVVLNGATGADEDRLRSWSALNETGRPSDGLTFLVNVLGSELERESAAAAAALWRLIAAAGQEDLLAPPWRVRDLYYYDRLSFGRDRYIDERLLSQGFTRDYPPRPRSEESLPWSGEQWREQFSDAMARMRRFSSSISVIALLVRSRLARALRSADPVTLSFAMAAFEPSGSEDRPPASPPSSEPTPPGALVVSTIIHGTWGWKGDWWRPGSVFHQFLLHNHRPNLYARGAKYSWSGAYSDKQRLLAAEDFCEWAYDVAPNGLQTVFGHSYGGEVAARAVLLGARVNELVLLSAPVTPWVEAAVADVPRTVDVRLRFDPVLALAQTPQRLSRGTGNTTTVLLSRWRYSHGASHDDAVWEEENVAQRGNL